MWCIRILSGPLTGQILNLKSGSNKVGRAPNCDTVIASPGVSKVHAQIDILGNKAVITDLNSSNGTFVNGIQIKSQTISEGDKISLCDTLLEIIPAGSNVLPMTPNGDNTGEVYEQAMQVYQGNAAPVLQAQENFEAHPQEQASGQAQAQAPRNSAEFVARYFEDVIMPGIYRLTEWMDFKILILIFCLVNVVVVTSLSTIPLTMILKTRLESSSQQRALSLARALAVSNQSAVQQGLMTGVNIHMVSNEPGVNEAYVINNEEGRILAPPSLAQQIPDEAFIHEARRFGRESVKQLSSTKIGALVPIIGRNPQTGLEAPIAHAVIIYDMGIFAVDDGQTFSLFVKSLFIALLVGAIVFFLLYRVMLHAIVQVNRQVSDSLRTGDGQIKLDYQFSELQELIGNINSALSRVDENKADDGMSNYEYDRSGEVQGVVNTVGFAAIAIRPDDQRVIGLNSHFEDQISNGVDWNQMPLDDILDNSLKENLKGILENAVIAPGSMANDNIDINGITFDLQGQAIYGSKEIAYVVIAFIPREEG